MDPKSSSSNPKLPPAARSFITSNHFMIFSPSSFYKTILCFNRARLINQIISIGYKIAPLLIADIGKSSCLIWQLGSELQNMADPESTGGSQAVKEGKAMGIDENDFFRRATMQICSSLEI